MLERTDRSQDHHIMINDSALRSLILYIITQNTYPFTNCSRSHELPSQYLHFLPLYWNRKDEKGAITLEEKNKKKEQEAVTDVCMNRRSFLQKSAKGIGGLVAVSSGIPILLSACSPNQDSSQSNESVSTESLVDLGSLEEIKKGPFPLKIDYNAKLKDGWTTSDVKGIVYVTKNDQGELYILSSTCTQ